MLQSQGSLNNMEKTEIKITTTHDDGSEYSTTVNSEGLDIEVVTDLLERALLGHGFHPSHIDDLFKD